ncbi:MAG TPA: energy transducer TonB [Candidatus Acidoferrum sp.]|nr:energy transducer TonB [Candidatus Acidoferrum sp.]
MNATTDCRIVTIACRFPLAAVLFLAVFAPAAAQQPPAPSASAAVSPATAPTAAYSESSSGLEKLMKDILRATKDGDTVKSRALLSSLALPDPEAWFRGVFGSDAPPMLREHPQSPPVMERALIQLFSKLLKEKFTDVRVQKHEKTCDDNSGEQIYPVLVMRQSPVPLYEVRFQSGTNFYRLWAVAYADGGFRFAGHLHVPESFFPPEIAGGQSVKSIIKRISVAGNVAKAKLVRQVTPRYPEAAKQEHLQGTVRLHAIIQKDGSIRQLRVLTGYCSLSEASIEAVRQWRYRPTLLNGEPVEVDTIIEVIFQLRS